VTPEKDPKMAGKPPRRRNLRTDRAGISSLEYGLIAAIIGGVLILSVTSFGNSLANALSMIGATLENRAAGM
jgi:Flp pilus assembly pilin Flp